MKKKYFTPEEKVVVLNAKQRLLAGSMIGTGAVNLGYGGSGSDDDDDGYLDDGM